jgi:hypothetical protein
MEKVKAREGKIKENTFVYIMVGRRNMLVVDT